jgi:hypothetical protein
MKALIACCSLAGVLLSAAVGARGLGAFDPPPVAAPPQARMTAPLPATLQETRLYETGSAFRIRGDILAFSPQYPLWSDGTQKRRWVWLPPGTEIDASRPDQWEFPVGTRFWKEFSYGRRIETRLIERLPDRSWRFVAYRWNEEESDAALVPADGAAIPWPREPGRMYKIPSRDDCLACHDPGLVPVLGFSALQLSPDRDPLAPHADPPDAGSIELHVLAAKGLLRNLPQALLQRPPRIFASSPTARAALGYLHGNCGHCHNAEGPLSGLDLVLVQQVLNPADSSFKVKHSLIGRLSRFRPAGTDLTHRIAPSGASILTTRMRTENPFARMPPLGVTVVDADAVSLIERWIREDLQK